MSACLCVYVLKEGHLGEEKERNEFSAGRKNGGVYGQYVRKLNAKTNEKHVHDRAVYGKGFDKRWFLFSSLLFQN